MVFGASSSFLWILESMSLQPIMGNGYYQIHQVFQIEAFYFIVSFLNLLKLICIDLFFISSIFLENKLKSYI